MIKVKLVEQSPKIGHRRISESWGALAKLPQHPDLLSINDIYIFIAEYFDGDGVSKDTIRRKLPKYIEPHSKTLIDGRATSLFNRADLVEFGAMIERGRRYVI